MLPRQVELPAGDRRSAGAGFVLFSAVVSLISQDSLLPASVISLLPAVSRWCHTLPELVGACRGPRSSSQREPSRTPSPAGSQDGCGHVLPQAGGRGAGGGFQRG